MCWLWGFFSTEAAASMLPSHTSMGTGPAQTHSQCLCPATTWSAQTDCWWLETLGHGCKQEKILRINNRQNQGTPNGKLVRIALLCMKHASDPALSLLLKFCEEDPLPDGDALTDPELLVTGDTMP